MSAERPKGQIFSLTERQKEAVVDKIVSDAEQQRGIFLTLQGLQQLLQKYDLDTPMGQIINDIRGKGPNEPKH